MIEIVKKVIKGILPVYLINKVTDTFNEVKLKKAINAMENAANQPAYLPESSIAGLMKNYSYEEGYGYDLEALKQRGIDRSNEIITMLGDQGGTQKDFLEIGCGDGMVSGILQQHGKTCTAIDFYDGGFDKRALNDGVKFYKMDAAEITFPDQTFDFVFSYNSYEHFPHPDKVFAESLRVLRPGGFMYMEFAPIFMSSYGLHAYKTIPIPFCQHLFKESDLDQYSDQHNLSRINYAQLNRWTLDNFRKLWKDHETQFEKTIYVEHKNFTDLHLIWEYPSCFKSKTNNYENFLVGGIKALFKKK